MYYQFNKYSIVFLSFSGLGSISFSESILIGIAGTFKAPTGVTGASRYLKHSRDILELSASAKEFCICSSVSTIHLPCFLPLHIHILHPLEQEF